MKNTSDRQLSTRRAGRKPGAALLRWGRLGLRRFAVVGLLGRIWELRENLSAYDASYVSLAEALGCELVTADARLAGAPGPRCAVTTVRR
ncbi:MAG: type II toxin-antitoxin system VapC family toxin [Solirubrobacteraceae bacterium]